MAGATATVDAATEVGKLVAERVKAAGITTVVFDRGGFKYHGRVAAVADGARSRIAALRGIRCPKVSSTSESSPSTGSPRS